MRHLPTLKLSKLFYPFYRLSFYPCHVWQISKSQAYWRSPGSTTNLHPTKGQSQVSNILLKCGEIFLKIQRTLLLFVHHCDAGIVHHHGTQNCPVLGFNLKKKYPPELKLAENRLHQQPCPSMQFLKIKGICVQQKIICSSFYKEPFLDMPFKDESIKKLVLLHIPVARPNRSSCCVLYFDVV